MSQPKILIIAGPNGAGKTTFAPEIAAIKSARLMLQEMTECSQSGASFAVETTLSGLTYIQHIKKWQAQGYHVSLFFLALNSVDLAINRVAQRVQQGGHNIPEEVIRRRFAAGLSNFKEHYRSIVNAWALYDNSGDEPNLIECGEHNGR